jgi:hypothetical protein
VLTKLAWRDLAIVRRKKPTARKASVCLKDGFGARSTWPRNPRARRRLSLDNGSRNA